MTETRHEETCHRAWDKINTTGATYRAGTAYTFEAPEFIPRF